MHGLTCGIVGAGSIGGLIASLLEMHSPGKLRLAAVADIRPEKLPSNIPSFTDHRKMIDSVDVVLIATPPSTHFQIARDCLAAGRHVYLEKPPVDTQEQALELIDVSRRCGATLFFGYHARYNKAVLDSVRAIDGRTITNFQIDYRENVLNYHAPDSWVMAEGVLRDSGINAISVLTRLLIEANSLYVTQAKWELPRGSPAETKVEVTFGYQTGWGTLSMDWNYPGKEVRTVQFTTLSGDVFVDMGRDSLAAEYERMLQHFADCAAAGESFCPLEEMRILDSIRSVAALG